MRILHCIPALYGGGAERQLSYLSVALKNKGVDIHVAYHLHSPECGEIRDTGIILHKLHGHGNHDPGLLWQLIKIASRLKPDLIQTWLLQMDVLGGLAALITKTPLLMTERSVAAAYKGLWKESLRNWIGRRATLIVANSEGGREYWLSKKNPNFIKIVPNAVPIEEIQQASTVRPENCGVGEDTEILLFAGRYSPEKNLFILLDAFFLVLSERPKAMAFLFGVGPLTSELMAHVKRHNIENRIKIMGHTQHIWGWMKRASVFVSISHFEGSPNVVYEAAATGCPLVLSDIPQHRELLSDDAASFVPTNAPTEIAKCILDILRNPKRANRKTQFAYRKATGFTIDSIANTYLGFYNSIISQKPIA